jgi:TolB-like protein
MFNLEAITWLDHYSSQGWQPIPTEAQKYSAITIGYNVFEDEDTIVLAQTVSEDAVADLMHILKVNVLDRKEIYVKKTSRPVKTSTEDPS